MAPIRREYVWVISQMGFDVEIDEAATGEELVERVLVGNYDLIFTDNRMPPGEMTGMEAIQTIREAKIDTPAYVITADSRGDIEANILAAGATGYIDKIGDAEKVLEEKVKLHLGGE